MGDVTLAENNVASDSTFFIAFLSKNEINDVTLLAKIVQYYKFYIGQKIKMELMKYKKELVSSGIIHNLIMADLNYTALLSIFGHKIFSKGEYEAIAIAYELHKYAHLHSLILDDKRARNFVKSNFPELDSYVKYSLRFIVDSYCKDETLTKKEVLSFLERVIDAIQRNVRPFNLTSQNRYIIKELILEVERCRK